MKTKLLAVALTLGGLFMLEGSAKAQVIITSGYGGGYYRPYVAPVVYSRPVYVQPVYVQPVYVQPVGLYGRYYGNPGYYGGNGITYSNFGRNSGYSISVGNGGFGFSSFNYGGGRYRRW
jgi:hypothetical protein